MTDKNNNWEDNVINGIKEGIRIAYLKMIYKTILKRGGKAQIIYSHDDYYSIQLFFKPKIDSSDTISTTIYVRPSDA